MLKMQSFNKITCDAFFNMFLQKEVKRKDCLTVYGHCNYFAFLSDKNNAGKGQYTEKKEYGR